MAKEKKDKGAAADAAPPAAAAAAPTGGGEKPKGEGAEGAPGKKKKPGVPPRRGKKLRNHLKNVEKKLREAGPVSVRQAVAAGADVVGGADLVEKVQKENFLDFDVALASQDMMGMVSRLGKVLGPRGLMPTPKAGTVVPATGDLAAAVREFKAGKVEYRSDKTGQIHAGVGKMSFDEQKLVENINAFVEQVRSVKPSGVKGNFINGVVLSATMSPGIRVAF